jgi:hypothetical protein
MDPHNNNFDRQPGAEQPQPAQGFFPSNQAALLAEQQRQAMAANPAIQPMSSSAFAARKPVGWIMATALLAILVIAVLSFGYWAFSERQTYKNDSDKLVAAAVTKAEKATTEQNNKKFAEELKNPLKTYTGPSSYGSITIQYPKTWSGYVSTANTSGAVLDGYFNPDVVPTILQSNSGQTRQPVALKVQVIAQTYDQVVTARKSFITSGKLVASPYALPKMPDQVGTKFVGAITNDINGTEYVLPLRDKTLVISTESDQFLNDINTYILPNFTFEP